MTHISIPNSVINIEWGAFEGCTNLSATWYYNPFFTAEDFYLTDYLTSVNLAEVTEISANAFEGCSGLTDVTIPNSVNYVFDYAFAGCINLTSIIIDNGVTFIGDFVFQGCTGLTYVTLPNSITYIGNYAFDGCMGLTHITIPNSITSLGLLIFFGCENLSVTWNYNSSTTAEGLDILNYLTEVNLEGVTTIIYGAFRNCIELTTIRIPATVATIGSHAFQGCSNLSIYAQVTSKPSGWNIDWNSSNCPVYWKKTSAIDVIGGFGYTGTTYYWKGAVTVANYYSVNGAIVCIGENLIFAVRTISSKNAWSKINGTLSFRLNNTLIHTSTVSVSTNNLVTINNGSFSINTADLDNGTYTLTLYSNFTRAIWSETSIHTFTFIVDK